MTAAIAVEGLTVRYGELVALDDVTLRVEPGRVCALVGMNGSGKSTLFQAMIGLVSPATGLVRIGGADPARARRRGLIGYVPQSAEIDRDFPISVGEVAMMGRYGRQNALRRIRPSDRRAVDDALARVELTALAGRRIGRLSGGQSKRAFLARAIAQEAEILLLDEPFAGVDKPSEQAMVRLLRGLAAEGRTIVISTHDLHGVADLADEVLLLRGRVLRHGPVAEVLTPTNIAEAFGL